MNKQIILFDGVCNLCNSAVNFIIKRDKKNSFVFASLQSKIGKTLLEKHSLNNLDTIVLIKDEKVYLRSEAIFQIIKEFNSFWSLLQLFKLLPLKSRDYLYTKVAKNRYKIFGKKDKCILPMKNIKDKFL